MFDSVEELLKDRPELAKLNPGLVATEKPEAKGSKYHNEDYGGIAVDKIDCQYTREIVCPYCGYIDRDSWEVDFGDSPDGEVVCGSCDETFLASRSVCVSYSSEKKAVD